MHVERALGWIDANLQQPLPGFLSYGTRSSKGLVNQGWKDSYNCIVNADGSLAEPPIALVEVQGYVYGAWHGAARLFRLAGDAQQAAVLERKAAELKQRFNARYWAPERNYYALALQRDARPALAVASNPGQALLFGIADPDKAQAVAQRVMAQDMFCGWGVRTLSSDEVAYNPLDYQVGSVWPHDNALIALGLRRSGFAEQAGRVFTGIFQAATQFPEYRLPEVFDGFAQDQYNRPVRYPVACNPQAWAAGALPQLLTAALGLEPDAGAGLLRIRNPHLPSWLSSVTVRGLRVGAGSADLRYEREDETTLVATLRCEDLRVAIEY